MDYDNLTDAEINDMAAAGDIPFDDFYGLGATGVDLPALYGDREYEAGRAFHADNARAFLGALGVASTDPVTWYWGHDALHRGGVPGEYSVTLLTSAAPGGAESESVLRFSCRECAVDTVDAAGERLVRHDIPGY